MQYGGIDPERLPDPPYEPTPNPRYDPDILDSGEAYRSPLARQQSEDGELSQEHYNNLYADPPTYPAPQPTQEMQAALAARSGERNQYYASPSMVTPTLHPGERYAPAPSAAGFGFSSTPAPLARGLSFGSSSVGSPMALARGLSFSNIESSPPRRQPQSGGKRRRRTRQKRRRATRKRKNKRRRHTRKRR